MQKEIKILIGVIIAAIIGGFYWYEWRPAQARKECGKEAAEKIRKIKNFESTDEIKTWYNLFYKRCLQKHGVKN